MNGCMIQTATPVPTRRPSPDTTLNDALAPDPLAPDADYDDAPAKPAPNGHRVNGSHDAGASEVKTFVVDTNVLLHNPNALYLFADNELVIPFDVIEELDTFKGNTDDLGRNARSVIRHLDRFRALGKLTDGVPIDQTGGRLRIVAEHAPVEVPLSADSPDNRIIRTAYALHQERKTRNGRLFGDAARGKHPAARGPVIFVSKDINARIKADTLGLAAEDFEAQKVDFEHLYSGHRELTVPAALIDALYADKRADVPADLLQTPLGANEFVLLRDESNDSHTAIARYRPEARGVVPLRPRRGATFGIAPRNLQQTMALDLLLDDSVKLVSLIGAAGTGKTLLALAAGMTKLLNDQTYTKLLAARPIMPLGRDIGYLPGSKDEKLSAWMQPIFDNLTYLLGNRLAGEHGPSDAPQTRAQQTGVEARVQQLVEAGQVVLEPLTYIRGRSIPHQYMIVDEAQNLTPHEVKTIASRVGEGTKLVLTGDPTQIDNPYLDASSNGLSYLVERLRDQSLVGHVTLAKSERSELASLVTDVL